MILCNPQNLETMSMNLSTSLLCSTSSFDRKKYAPKISLLSSRLYVFPPSKVMFATYLNEDPFQPGFMVKSKNSYWREDLKTL